jgi:plasmid maintenance system antidote protein VapI
VPSEDGRVALIAEGQVAEVTTPAENLRKARIKRGFPTATDAARYFGWKAASYAHHENGTRGITPDMARRYARAYRISADDLYGIVTACGALARTKAAWKLMSKAEREIFLAWLSDGRLGARVDDE